jgi:hypothetical protein
MSALQQQIHSSLEASRNTRIVGVDAGTDTAISVRGLRPTVLLVRFGYEFDPGADGEFAVGVAPHVGLRLYYGVGPIRGHIANIANPVASKPTAKTQ